MFRQVEEWLPPLDGEEAEELKETKEEAGADSEVSGGSESEPEAPAPAVVPGRKTRLQKQKEVEAAQASHPDSTPSEASSSSDDVEEVPDPQPERQKSTSQVEVAIKEELRTKSRQDRSSNVGLHRPMRPKVERAAPLGHPRLRKLPVAR